MKRPFGCVNNTIRLRSGRYFDLADPQPDQFTFADIAGALSKICRFGGQIENFYCGGALLALLPVRRQFDQNLDTQVAVLMHDAAEAFCGDVVKPLKIMLPEYAVVEARIQGAIAEKFLIDFDRESYMINECDHTLLIAEKRALFSSDQVYWAGEDKVDRIEFRPRLWSPPDAEREFVVLARSIGIDVKT